MVQYASPVGTGTVKKIRYHLSYSEIASKMHLGTIFFKKGQLTVDLYLTI